MRRARLQVNGDQQDQDAERADPFAMAAVTAKKPRIGKGQGACMHCALPASRTLPLLHEMKLFVALQMEFKTLRRPTL